MSSMKVSSDDVRLYAALSRDFNAIHVDEKFAAQSEFGSRIAHGTIASALILRAIAEFLPKALRVRRCEVKFVGTIPINDTLEVNREALDRIGGSSQPALLEGEHEVSCARSDGAIVAVALCTFGRTDAE